MSPDWALSIDFGTSNTAAAHLGAVSGNVEALSLSHSSTLMSSGVFVDTPDRIAVGDHATNEAQRNPAAFIPSPKRLIGAPGISVNRFDLPTWRPVAAVLSSVLGRASAAHAQTMPSHVVLTHPEAWSPSQVDVLRHAAVTVGIPADRVSTISEPRAAAAHYARTTSIPDGGRVAVFDFGGGTLDVAVLRKEHAGGFTVLAARGDNSSGGKNFDSLLHRWVQDRLATMNPSLLEHVRRAATAAARHQLDESIRAAKELLSESPSASIPVAGGGLHEMLQITRDEFDDLITPQLTNAYQLTRATFLDAGLSTPDDVIAIYLTGGTSRIPLVHRVLSGLGAVVTLDNPKTVVALGALASWSDRSRPSVPAPSADRDRWSPVDVPVAPVAPQARAPRRRRRLVLASVAGVVVVAAVVGGIVLRATGVGDGSDDSPTAAAQSTAAAPLALSTTQEQVRAALPQTVRDVLTGCAQATYPLGKGVGIQCRIPDGSPLLEGTEASGDYGLLLTADIDDVQSAKELARFKAGAVGSATYLPGFTADSGAQVYKAGGNANLPDDTFLLSYANRTTNLELTIATFDTEAGARAFATRVGFVP